MFLVVREHTMDYEMETLESFEHDFKYLLGNVSVFVADFVEIFTGFVLIIVFGYLFDLFVLTPMVSLEWLINGTRKTIRIRIWMVKLNRMNSPMIWIFSLF